MFWHALILPEEGWFRNPTTVWTTTAKNGMTVVMSCYDRDMYQHYQNAIGAAASRKE